MKLKSWKPYFYHADLFVVITFDGDATISKIDTLETMCDVFSSGIALIYSEKRLIKALL